MSHIVSSDGGEDIRASDMTHSRTHPLELAMDQLSTDVFSKVIEFLPEWEVLFLRPVCSRWNSDISRLVSEPRWGVELRRRASERRAARQSRKRARVQDDERFMAQLEAWLESDEFAQLDAETSSWLVEAEIQMEIDLDIQAEADNL